MCLCYVSFFKSGIWRTMLIHVRVRAYDIDIDPNYTIDRPHTTWFIHGMGHESLDNYMTFFDCLQVSFMIFCSCDEHRHVSTLIR